MPIYVNRTNAGKNQMPRAGCEPTTSRSHEGALTTELPRQPEVIDHTHCMQYSIFRTNCSSSERSTLICLSQFVRNMPCYIQDILLPDSKILYGPANPLKHHQPLSLGLLVAKYFIYKCNLNELSLLLSLFKIQLRENIMTERYIAIKNKTVKLFIEKLKCLILKDIKILPPSMSIGQINLLTLFQCCHGFQNFLISIA